MDCELRIVVEKIAVSSQEVVKRDTIISYALQCPTSILELGLRHTEQIALLEREHSVRLLLNSRVVDVPRSSNPIVVPLSSSNPLFFNDLKKAVHFSGNVGA